MTTGINCNDLCRAIDQRIPIPEDMLTDFRLMSRWFGIQYGDVDRNKLQSIFRSWKSCEGSCPFLRPPTTTRLNRRVKKTSLSIANLDWKRKMVDGVDMLAAETVYRSAHPVQSWTTHPMNRLVSRRRMYYPGVGGAYAVFVQASIPPSQLLFNEESIRLVAEFNDEGEIIRFENPPLPATFHMGPVDDIAYLATYEKSGIPVTSKLASALRKL